MLNLIAIAFKRVGIRKFLGLLIVLILSTVAILQVDSSLKSMLRMEEHVAAARSGWMDAKNVVADIEHTYMASLHKAFSVCKLAFAILMFGFAFQESVHVAKSAWRAYHDAKKMPRAALKLAFMLILCAGPIGYYGLEVPIHMVEAIVV